MPLDITSTEIRSGDLRHKVEIQVNRDEERTDYGTTESGWRTIARPWVGIEPLNGRQLFTSGTIQADVTTAIIMRYFTGLTPDHRIKHGDRIFEISSVINVQERNRKHVLLCNEAPVGTGGVDA